MPRSHRRSFHTFINKYLPKGKTILELGSGDGSKRLVEAGYTVYAVEHDEGWITRWPNDVNYIYAPLREHKKVEGFDANVWYDPAYLQDLPDYDLIIVDGPPGCEGRSGFLKYFDELFKSDVPIVIDDMQRVPERLLVTRLAKKLKRPYYVETRYRRTMFAVMLPERWDWYPIIGESNNE